MRLSVAYATLLVGCLEPKEHPAPVAPPGTRTMILTAARGDASPALVIRSSGFEEELTVSAELRWLAFYYACSPAELGLNDSSTPKPVPQTWAAQEWTEEQWRALPPEEIEAARGTAMLAHPEVPCADLQLDEEQLTPLSDADGITHGTWLDPQREEVLIVDERGRLWRGRRGAPPELWPIDPTLDLLAAEYSPEHQAVFAVGLERPAGRWVTARLTSDLGLEIIAQQEAPPSPMLMGRSSANLLGFAPGQPLEMYLVTYNAGLARYRDGLWTQELPGWERQVATGLVVLGREDLLVMGRCPNLNSAPGGTNFGCDQSIAHLTRNSMGEWDELHRRTPRDRILTSLAMAKDGTTYVGTIHGQLYARAPNEGAWQEIQGTGTFDGVERLAAFEDGVVAGLDGGGVYRVRPDHAPRCPKLFGRLEHRGLVSNGSRFALIGPVPDNSAFGVLYGQTRDFDCRLPSLVQTE